MTTTKLTAIQRRWISATLANDETSTDEQLVEYFVENGLSEEQAKAIVSKRAGALNQITWRLK